MGLRDACNKCKEHPFLYDDTVSTNMIEFTVYSRMGSRQYRINNWGIYILLSV